MCVLFFERGIDMTEEQNLLSGSVPKKLAAFAFPLLLANILQSFYNVVDMLVVGQIVGDTGLAAINNASKLCYIINSICIGMTMGGAVLIAQYKGANDKKGQTETFQTLAVLSFVSALLITVIGLAFYQPLFRVLNVPADTYQDACDYMKIICWGTIFVFGYNAVCSVLKGLGDSKSPLYFVGIATIINIVLDILLVGPFGMGTSGAAYATITAQGISFVISIFYLRKHKVFFSANAHKKFTFQMDKLVSILKVGLPTAIQMVVVNTAYLLVTGMLNQFGTSVSAASGVGLQINTFAGMPCWAIGQAVTAMVMSFTAMGASTLFMVQIYTLIQTQTPPQLVGKIMAALISIAMCGQPIGQAIYGVLFDILAAHTWMVLIGAAIAAFLVSLYSKKIFGRLETSK